MNLPVLYVPQALPPPGFWARLGASISGAAVTVGESVVVAFRSVDLDVRRELAILPLMGLTSIGRRHVDVRPKADDGERPVIFVHGMGGHRANFGPMTTFFRAQGRRRMYAVGLPAKNDAAGHASHLVRFIDEVLEANDMSDGQVDLVAHSRGGVICRLALDDVHTARRVHTLVTLGTPHKGTVTARYGRGSELDELRPDSAVIARMHEQLPWTGPRLVCLWSAQDPLVAPPTHAQVEGATNIELEGLTHCQLLLWPAGWRAAYDAVATG